MAGKLTAPRTEMQKQAFDKRQRVWRHNSFKGQAIMARSNLTNMLASDSLTDASKLAAQEALDRIRVLVILLNVRKDP